MPYRPTTRRDNHAARPFAGSVCGPATAITERVYAPAASLAFAYAPLRRRAARTCVAAGAKRIGRAAIPPLPRPCPVSHPKRCSSGGCTLSRLGAPRTASLSSAASASPLRRLPSSSRVLRALRSSGIRSAGPRSLRFASVAGARSGASPLLPRVRPAARAAFSRRPCRSAPAAPLLRLASLAATEFTFGIVRHTANCIYTVLIFNPKNYIC